MYFCNMSKLHNETVEQLANSLEDDLRAPMWSQFVKTSHGNERPPQRDDWWYVRGAAILLSVKKLGPIGTNKLSRKYGTKKDRGYEPEVFVPASRKIIRTLLQQLEEEGYVEHGEEGNHKGRMITDDGNDIISSARSQAKDTIEA